MRKATSIILVVLTFFALACNSSKTYSADVAKKNGDVISYETGGKSENVVKLLEFIKNVKGKKEANVRVVSYADQETPVIVDLSFDGKKIKYNRKTDPNGKGEETICTGIIDSGMGIFGLKGCQGDKESIGVLSTSHHIYIKAKNKLEK